MRMVPHADWWVLRDDDLDALALVCPEDAERYADHIPVAVSTVKVWWALSRNA